jgi:hypothetical protein
MRDVRVIGHYGIGARFSSRASADHGDDIVVSVDQFIGRPLSVLPGGAPLPVPVRQALVPVVGTGSDKPSQSVCHESHPK